MSSSDSDAPKKQVRRRAAKDDSDSDSDDDQRKQAVVRRGGGRGRAAAAKSSGSDSSDSDSDSPSKPTTRRQARAAKASDSDSDSDSGAPAARQPRQVDLWPVINYDDMSEEAFYELLKSKTRQQRQEDRKKWTEGKGAEEEVEKVEPFSDDANAGYTYSKMLERVYNIINGGSAAGGTVAGGEKKVKLPVPVVEKSGTKTTSLNNFAKMCKAMNREQSQVKDFIEKELTTTSSVDSNSCLIMKLRNVKVHQMEQVFQKYVEAYCQCGNCGSIRTTLEKNPTTRLWVLKCQDCKASRNVQTATGATYKAQIGKRPKQF